MDIRYHSEKYQVTDHFREIVAQKLEQKIAKFVAPETKADVIAKTQQGEEILEIIIGIKPKTIRTTIVGRNMYQNIDDVVAKLETQFAKKHDKKVNIRGRAT